MMIQRTGALAVLLAATLLAGCAHTGTAGADGSGVAAPGPSSTGPDLSPPGGASGPPVDPGPGPGGKPGAGAMQTLTGTIADGVEPNCLVLNSPGGDRLLIISDEALRATAKAGASVTVVGRAEPRMMTTCQQGIPFIVSQVTLR